MGHGQVREQPQNEDGRDHEEGACHDAPQRPVQPPPDVGGHLLRLGTGQEHAEVERPQVLLLRNPTFLLHQLAVHDGDLASGPPEVDEPELYPEPERLPEPYRLGLPGRTVLRNGLGIHSISTALVNKTDRRRVTVVTQDVKGVFARARGSTLGRTQWEWVGRPSWLWEAMRWWSSPASCRGSTCMTAPLR